jgi:hypothetical protein
MEGLAWHGANGRLANPMTHISGVTGMSKLILGVSKLTAARGNLALTRMLGR